MNAELYLASLTVRITKHQLREEGAQTMDMSVACCAVKLPIERVLGEAIERFVTVVLQRWEGIVFHVLACGRRRPRRLTHMILVAMSVAVFQCGLSRAR